MKIVYTLLIFVFSIHILAQGKTFKGKIRNQFKELLSEVKITVKSSNKVVKSDCKGRFKTEVLENDILVFKKNNYVLKEINVNTHKNSDIILDYDYKSVISKLDRTTEDIDMPFGCNPLYILDGSVIRYNTNKKGKEITKNDIKSIKVFKGKDATDKFGKYAMNGLFWITTKCR